MILELDCGNSLIKWRVLIDGLPLPQRSGVALDETDLLCQLSRTELGGSIQQARVVSVRAEDETNSLIVALRSKFSIPVQLAISAARLAGVSNGYLDPGALGADRWLALVAAYLNSGSACLVLDIGTAVTSDFVSRDGNHLGGLICPGIKLMRTQLEVSTGRIGAISLAEPVESGPGRKTSDAVMRGTQMMLIGFVDTQVKMARELWGEDFKIVFTGGDASLVKPYYSEAVIIPDLVFRGLAVACPY